ncbi:MAG: DUF483 domain-containing protein [Archaeoglobaceae archaeon]
MLKVNVRSFLSNPVFFIEVSRILAGISKLVTLKPFEPRSLEADFCNKNGLRAFLLEARVSRILSDSKIIPASLFFVAKDKRFVRAIQRLENRVLSGAIDFERGRRKLIKLEGEAFGYPECCVKAYARSKGDFPLETKLILECFEFGTFESLIDSLKKSEVCFFPQFFTMNFYPCHVDCRRAKGIGFKLEKFLGNYENAFRLRTMLNALYLLRVAYKSTFYSGSLSKTAREFFRQQEKYIVETLRAIAELDYEEFSNNFIRRALLKFQR